MLSVAERPERPDLAGPACGLLSAPSGAGPGTPAGALAYAHREAYPLYFARLASHPDAGAALRRLITHLDADLDGGERLALWQALWATYRRLSPVDRAPVVACLDGRHATALAPLVRPWNDLALIEHLATCTQPAAAQAAFVPALLAHHDLEPLAPPHGPSPGLSPGLSPGRPAIAL